MNATGPVTIADQGSGLFTTTVGNGVGGNINLRGSVIQLSNGASISATSSGTGNAGNITVNAGNQFAMTNSASHDGGPPVERRGDQDHDESQRHSAAHRQHDQRVGSRRHWRWWQCQYRSAVCDLAKQSDSRPGRTRAWREHFDHDESAVTGFDQSHLGLLAIWPARHDHHSIAHFSSKRQDRSARAEAADPDHTLEPALRSTRWWERSAASPSQDGTPCLQNQAGGFRVPWH